MHETEEASLNIWIKQFKKISSRQSVPQSLEEIKSHHQKLDNTLDFGPAFYVITDYTSFTYKYVSDSIYDITGLSQEFMLQEGFAGFDALINPEVKVLLQKIWSTTTDHVKNIPYSVLQKISCAYDWHFMHQKGRLIHILQQTLLLKTDEDGRFLYELIKCTDITHWQKQSPMCCTLTAPDPQFNLIYYPGEDLKIVGLPFSSAELKVLELLAEGNQSKNIAEQLHISHHTVDTHRRNMLRKTKSSNTQDLIRLAYLSGSI